MGDRGRLDGLHVLVVDDNGDFQEFLVKIERLTVLGPARGRR